MHSWHDMLVRAAEDLVDRNGDYTRMENIIGTMKAALALKREAPPMDTKAVLEEATEAMLTDASRASWNSEVVNAMVDKILDEHPTKQASFVRMMIRVLYTYGRACRVAGREDGRNEAAVDACLKLREAAEMPIPYI